MAATAADEDLAETLARRLGSKTLATGADPAVITGSGLVLLVRGGVLSLQQTGKGAPGPVAVDFASAALDYRRRDNSPELLGKAVGHVVKRPLRILDATAGLGTDAFVLAHLGHEVRMCERDPVVAELLRNGLESAQARADAGLASVVARLTLVPLDARDCGERELESLDVIYLDPMFPGRVKSAAVKKEMAVLQQLLGDASADRDAEALLQWALQRDVARVVVKRPASASSLADLDPSHRIEGKAVRYDVYVKRKLA